jgi:3-deoxy-manno-octulosonate cytidylyltransferase (CMP-KDO synthetase)
MTPPRILGIIPARYASTRLPGKPLVDIGGRSLVMRVFDQARLATKLSEVVVATDDERILDHVMRAGGNCVLTSADHPSGTDRCWEALETLGADEFDAVINIQGDEPFIAAEQIDELADAISQPGAGIATLAQVVTDDGDLTKAGEVMITVDHEMNALYFSRAAIPFVRDRQPGPLCEQFRYLKHVGLYAYRSDALSAIVKLPPSSLELAEALEQLRWLENGLKVRIGLTDHPSFCVDTTADLEEARRRVEAS